MPYYSNSKIPAGVCWRTVTVSANYSVLTTDVRVNCDATSAGFNVTLPAASSVDLNHIFYIEKEDGTSHVVTILPSGSDTISGGSSLTLSNQYDMYALVSTGSRWVLVSTTSVSSGNGTSGYSGYSGVNGTIGSNGVSGFSGYSGPAGANGAAGTSGFSGYSGPQGTSGFSGYSGPIGTSGFSGYSGPKGTSGFSGYSGPVGTSGFSGYSGPVGTSGFSGYSGPTGTSGFSGAGSTLANPTGTVGLTAVNGTAVTAMRSDAAPALDQSIAPTWTGQHIFSKNGAASTPTLSLTGTPFTGGTGTTTTPLLQLGSGGYTNWNTSGTMLGVNAPAGYNGYLAYFTTGTGAFGGVAIGFNGSLGCGDFTPGNIYAQGWYGCTWQGFRQSASGDDYIPFNFGKTTAGDSMRITGTMSNASGNTCPLAVIPTMSTTSTGGWTAFKVNPTQTSDTGSGTKLLADFQLNGASKFSVDLNGTITAGGFSSTSAGGVFATLYAVDNVTIQGGFPAASHSQFVASGSWYTGGTATTTKPQWLLEPSGTSSTNWSTAGTGIGINADSGFTGNLADFQLGGVSKFHVDKDGNVTANALTSANQINGVNIQAATITWGGSVVVQQAGLAAAGDNVQVATGTNTHSSGTVNAVNINPTMSSTSTGGWTALKVNPVQTSDTGSGTKLLADFQLGGTSKVRIDKDGSLIIGSGATVGSTYLFQVNNGTTCKVSMSANGDIGCTTIQANGNVSFFDSGLSTPGIISRTGVTLDVQTTGDSTARNIVRIGNATWTNSTGTMVGLAITPTYNQTSGAAATDLLINRTQTAVGSGAQLLIDAQVATVSKFKVDNTGTILAGTWNGAVVGAAYGGAGTVTGLLKANGSGSVSAAVSGTDYEPAWTTVEVATSDATTTGSTLVDVTGLTFSAATSTQYEFEAVLNVATSAVTTGCEYGVNVTVSPTLVAALFVGPTSVSAGVQTMQTSGTNVNNTASAAFLTTASETGVIHIRGMFTTAGTGSPVFSIRHLKVTSGTSTVKVGSVLRVRKL